MKKITTVIIMAVLIFAFFAVGVYAEEPTEQILEDFSAVIPEDVDVSVEDELVSEIGFEAILKEIFSAVSGDGGRALGFFLMLFGFAVIISAAGGSGIIECIPIKNGVETAVLAIASLSIFTALYDVCVSVRDSLVSVVDFFSSVIPILTVISTSMGSVSTATAQAANMNITLSLLEKFCTGALLTAVFAIFALAFVGSVSDNGAASVARGVKSVFMWGVGIIGAVLAATVAMQSVVASAQDSATLRAARYAASGMIPIVGSTVASALSTLGGGLAFIKSTVGAAAIAVILALALSPLVSLLLYRLAFSICVIFLEFSGSSGGVRCFSAFKSALDALIAVYSVSTLVCIVELIVFIKGGASV